MSLSSSTPTAAPSTESLGPEADAFITSLAELVCDPLERCCTESRLTYDRARCVASERASMRALAGRGGFDPDSAKRCLAAVTSRTDDPCRANYEVVLRMPGCMQAIQAGTKAPGEPCRLATDCSAVGGYPQCVARGDEPFHCVIEQPAKEGAPCMTTLHDPKGFFVSACYASKDLVCDEATLVCAKRARKANGASCKRREECDNGLLCEAGTCVVKTGQPCDGWGMCGTGEFCKAGRCAPKLANGERFDNLVDCAEWYDQTTHMCRGLGTRSCGPPIQ